MLIEVPVERFSSSIKSIIVKMFWVLYKFWSLSWISLMPNDFLATTFPFCNSLLFDLPIPLSLMFILMCFDCDFMVISIFFSPCFVDSPCQIAFSTKGWSNKEGILVLFREMSSSIEMVVFTGI